MSLSSSIPSSGVLREGPTALSAARLLVLPWLLREAQRGHRHRVSCAQITMIGVDVIDGMLARRIGHPDALRRQRRLDGLADLGLFAAAPWCAYHLCPEIAREQRRGLVALTCAQLTNLVICWSRFGRLPRYHTTLFRWSAAGVGLMLALRIESTSLGRPLRLAFLLHALAHLEAASISCQLQTYREPIDWVWNLHHDPIP